MGWSVGRGRSSGATPFAEPQRPPLEVDLRHGQGGHGDVPRLKTAAGRLRRLPLGGDRLQSSLACRALGWPFPARLACIHRHASRHVHAGWLGVPPRQRTPHPEAPLAPKLDPSDGKLKTMLCCWTPRRVLGSSPSLDSRRGPRIVAPKGRPAHPTTRFRSAHLTESDRGVDTERADRGRKQGRKSLKPCQCSTI
jgi:hypothetical protein